MRISRNKIGGKFPRLNTHATFQDFFWDWCERAYQPLRHAEKLLARDAVATPRTARGWLRREYSPHGEHFTNLLAANPELQHEYAEFVAGRRSDGEMLRAEAAAIMQRLHEIEARISASTRSGSLAANQTAGGAHVDPHRP